MRACPGGKRRAGPGEPEVEDAPSGTTSLKDRWRGPKVQATTASLDSGIRRRENNALCLILFFFLQCRRKEVGSSFVQNMLLPCVQQVPCYRSATQLHPFARPQQPHQAQRCCTAPHHRQRPLSDGARCWGDPLPGRWDPAPCLCNAGLAEQGPSPPQAAWRSPVHPSLQPPRLRDVALR